MTENWAQSFYRMQYHALNNSAPASTYYDRLAEKINEEAGKPYQTVLELGAGDGRLARSLADHAESVTTIELVQDMVDEAILNNPSNVHSICGDFYSVELNGIYDLVLYMDGFGVGEDADQIRLLNRIHDWIRDDGCALIDVYNPSYWKKADGIEMSPDPKRNPDLKRLYEYDADSSIMMDSWWHADDRSDSQTQYLKCYTPEEMHAMCRSADLDIIAYFPGGAMNYDNWQYHEPASLEECLSYRVKLKKKIQ